MQVSNNLLVTVDYSEIRVAKGNRELPPVMVRMDAESSELSFTWVQEDFVRHAADDDQLYAVILEQELKKAKVFLLGERKGTEPSKIVLPSDWKPDRVVLYVFILSKDRKNASMSKFMTIS